MVVLDEETLKRWKTKRKHTSIAFAIQRFLLGMDYSVKCITLWIYITTLIRLPNPQFYYALISFSYFSTTIFGSAIICKLTDRYRNIRTTFFLCNTAVIVGNIVYSLPLSPWCLVIGAVISGLGFPLNSVITGELARSYKHDQLTFQLSMCGMFGNVGFLLAPGINMAFTSVDVSLGAWHITYANLPVLYTAGAFVIMQFVCGAMISDLSKEYDMKAETEANATRGNVEANRTGIDVEGGACDTQRNADTEASLENVETGFHDAQGRIRAEANDTQENVEAEANDIQESVEAEANVIQENVEAEANDIQENVEAEANDIQENVEADASDTQKNVESEADDIGENVEIEADGAQEKLEIEASDKQSEPTIMYVFKEAMFHCDTVLLLFIAFFEAFLLITTDLWIPIMVIDVLGWPVQALNGIVLASGVTCIAPCVFLMYRKFSDRELFYFGVICLTMYGLIQLIFFSLSIYGRHYAFTVACWVCYVIFIAAATVVKDVIICTFLAKMVSSNIQSLIDSLRLTFSNIGSVLAMITAPFCFARIDVFALLYFAFTVVTIVVMLSRRRTLTRPQVIIKV